MVTGRLLLTSTNRLGQMARGCANEGVCASGISDLLWSVNRLGRLQEPARAVMIRGGDTGGVPI